MPTKPHFVVDSSFHTSDEVLSIPARYRHAAVGVWTLCGAWSVDNQRDGFLPAHALETLGVTPLLVAVLIESTLWEAVPGDDTDVSRNVSGTRPRRVRDAYANGVRFRNWGKWQRTKEQWAAGNKANAERQRRHRERQNNGVTSQPAAPESPPHSNVSKPTGNGVSNASSVVEESRDTYLRSEVSAPNVGRERDAERDISPPVEPSASRLVDVLIPHTFPAAVRTGLRLAASELIHTGTPNGDVAESLRRWLAKPDAGVGLLPHLAADVMRERAAPANGQPTSKLRTLVELEREVRAAETAEIPLQSKEIER